MKPMPSTPMPRPAQHGQSASRVGSQARPVSVLSASSTVASSSSSAPFRQNALLPRPQASVSQSTSGSRIGNGSTTSSSFPSRPRRQTSTTSGRKSRTASSIWGSDTHEVVCAVAEARGVAPSVGLAFVNIATNEVVLSQICDTQFYVKTIHKIQVYEPSVILMVNTAFPPNPKSSLLSVIEAELPETLVEALDRKYWSEHTGLEFIQTLAFRDDLDAIKVAIEGNFYATCSFAAVIKYVELSYQVSIAAHTLRIRYQPSEDTVLIDISTIHCLELIQNLQDARSRDSLFGLMNETITPMGSRMLRSNILQPSSQVERILMPRYDAVDELTVKEDMFFDIRKCLKAFGDAEKFLASLVIVRQQNSIYALESAVDLVLRVKAFVLAVPPLYDSLAAARTDLLKRIRELCRPRVTQPVADLIAETINEDVTAMKTPIDMRNQRTYAVKSGIDGLLDVARQTYKEATEDVYSHIEDINREHNMVAEVRFDNQRKFWLRLRDSDFEDKALPDILINTVTKNHWIECQTLLLVQINNRITDSHNETIMGSDKVVQQLLNRIRDHVPDLFRVCEGIALLDMIASFAQSATTRDYVRPEITNTLALKGARHPVCERINPERFVPNDVFANELHRFQIITGCNMSGKSTYIRMIPHLQVMAQIGSFVPAQYATFPIIHQLFVRMSTDDSIEANMSTFSLEMREMAFILRLVATEIFSKLHALIKTRNVNDKSLTIIDELGRGTSPRDGLAISLAISEALVQSNSMVWFATHFEEITEVLGHRPGVLNLHLATKMSQLAEDQARMTMLYKVESGPVREKNYGLNLAKAMGFPEHFIHVAEQISNKLATNLEEQKDMSESRRLHRQRKVILSLHDSLIQLKDSNMDDAALGSYMRRLQDEFLLRMDVENNDHGMDETQ